MAATPPTSPTPVSTIPPDLLGGSTIPVGGNAGDLQAAVNAAHPGDTLVVPSGATYSPVTLPARSDSGWITIRPSEETNLPGGRRVAPSDAAHMYKLVSDGSINTARALTVPSGSNGWRIIGMDATHPNDTAQYGVVDVAGNRVVFERSYVHGTPTAPFLARCFFWTGSDIQIWDSWLSEAQATGQDTQAIFIRQLTPTGLYHVENCELQATGENILLGDQGSPKAALDVVLARNHFFKPLSWQGGPFTIKNLLEMKFASRVLVTGNLLENSWPMAQDGTAILINCGLSGNLAVNVTDVLYQSNTVKNAPYLAAISTVNSNSVIPSRIAYQNNLGLQVHGRGLFLNHAAADVSWTNNTVTPQDGVMPPGYGPQGCVFLAPDANGSFPRLTIQQSVFGSGTYAVFINGGLTNYDALMPDRAWAQNVIYNQTGAVPSGFTAYPSAAAIGLDLATGQLTTPTIAGIGVDFAALTAAQSAGASVPAPPPPPPIPSPTPPPTDPLVALSNRVAALESWRATIKSVS